MWEVLPPTLPEEAEEKLQVTRQQTLDKTGKPTPHGRKGKLELAEGDCLFLDEIADIDPDTQRLLIRAVEQGRFHRMGDNQERRATFRLICATNRSLPELNGGLLDADFFDRIAIFTVEVPPLRACRDDLPLFWRESLRTVVRRAGLALRGWEELVEAPALLDRLRAHPLPGNLRDLQRVAWHVAVALHAGQVPEEAARTGLAALGEPAEPGLPSAESLRSRLPLPTPLPDQLDALRSRYVEAAYLSAGRNQAEAARLLGVKRETLKSWGRPGEPSR
jgi:DNA-binding NtrC family response regulator